MSLLASDFAYQGYYKVQLDGLTSPVMQGLTYRYVSGQFRLLSVLSSGTLVEWVPPGSYGSLASTTTQSWDISSYLQDYVGIWYEEAKSRLWVTTAQDYPDPGYDRDITLTILSLGGGGTATLIGSWTLDGITCRRAFGGVQVSPRDSSKYVVGWGGYTSLMVNFGNASLGPTMYEFPEPTTYGSSVIAVGDYTVVQDYSPADTYRGRRVTFPKNYYEDTTQPANPSSAPTGDPDPSAGNLSPDGSGNGVMVLGDTYLNTGCTIDGVGFLAILNACQGKCWYGNSTINTQSRGWELHCWDKATLMSPSGTRTPYDSGIELTDISLVNPPSNWEGILPAQGDVNGACYDAATNNLYLIIGGYGETGDASVGRLHVYNYGGTSSGGGGGGVSYQSSATAGGDTTSPAVSVPTGAQAGDVVLLVVTTDHTSTVFNGFWPSGFTHLDSIGTFGPDDQEAGIAYKVLSGADTGTYTTTIDCGTAPWGIAAVLMRGRDGTDVTANTVASSNAAGTSPLSIVTNSITALANDDILMVMCPDQNTNNVATGFTAPASYTQRVNGINLGTGGKANIGIAVQEGVSAGATGAVTGTYAFSSGTSGYATWLVRMAAQAAAPVTHLSLLLCGVG